MHDSYLSSREANYSYTWVMRRILLSVVDGEIFEEDCTLVMKYAITSSAVAGESGLDHRALSLDRNCRAHSSCTTIGR